jgi:hypothetical protein
MCPVEHLDQSEPTTARRSTAGRDVVQRMFVGRPWAALRVAGVEAGGERGVGRREP